MPRSRQKQINLTKFARGTAHLSPEYCGIAAAACALKLKQHGHATPAQLSIQGIFNETVSVRWDDPDPRTEGSLGDKATEFAGECVGIVLSEKLTDYNVVQRSFICSGFDFWLGKKRDALFQRKARLETSALDHGTGAEIDARVRKKMLQVDAGTQSRSGDALIVVSEFERPIAKVVRHA